MKSDAKIDGSNDRINCYSLFSEYHHGSMYTDALIKSASRFTQCMALAWRARARVFAIFYHKFNTIEKNSTVSDREFDSLANTVEFFGLRIFL